MSNSTSIRENIAAIRAQIDAAARETGRTGADITLVGASKMNGAAACQEAIAAGIDALGENRVQEMTAKLAEDAYRGAPLHFIGHLQRNKVKQVVGKAAVIASLPTSLRSQRQCFSKVPYSILPWHQATLPMLPRGHSTL